MVSKTVFALLEDSITYCKNISFRAPLLKCLKRRPKISRCYVERGQTETDLHFYVIIIIIIEYIYLIATESQLDRLVVRGQPQYGHFFNLPATLRRSVDLFGAKQLFEFTFGSQH